MRLPHLTWPPSPIAVLSYVAVVATVAALIGGGAAFRQASQNADRIEDIEQTQAELKATQDKLVEVQREACEGTNAIRTINRVQIQRDIDQSIAFESSGQYADFFPNIPADQLHKLLEEQRDDQRADKVKLANEECVTPAPPSPPFVPRP